jgi:hypothetical protein
MLLKWMASRLSPQQDVFEQWTMDAGFVVDKMA